MPRWRRSKLVSHESLTGKNRPKALPSLHDQHDGRSSMQPSSRGGVLGPDGDGKEMKGCTMFRWTTECWMTRYEKRELNQHYYFILWVKTAIVINPLCDWTQFSICFSEICMYTTLMWVIFGSFSSLMTSLQSTVVHIFFILENEINREEWVWYFSPCCSNRRVWISKDRKSVV